MKKIQPQGLTPLAAGIADTLEFIKARNLKDVLLILITDGIPTMNRWTADPARDALTAAKSIADRKITFMCVGLQPNRDFLSRLVDVAHGKLYICLLYTSDPRDVDVCAPSGKAKSLFQLAGGDILFTEEDLRVR